MKNYLACSPSVAVQFEWSVNMATHVKKIINLEESRFRASENTLEKNQMNFRSKFIGSNEMFDNLPAKLNLVNGHSSKFENQ